MHGSQNLTTKQALLHEKRQRAQHRKRVFFTVLFLLAVVGFFIVIRKPFLRIQSVTVNGNTLVSTDDVKSYVESKIIGYKLFLIPRNSVIFFKREKFVEDIKDKFPRLSNVLITGGNHLTITIAEPVFDSMYCNVNKTTGIPVECALLHPDGKTGSIAPIYSYSPFFTFYKVTEDLPNPGTHVISIEEINRVNGIKNEIEAANIPVVGYVYGEEYDEILLNTGADFKTLPRIRITKGAMRDEINRTLGTASRDEGVKKVLVEKINDLEYIDLRFNGQVVYKKRTE